jgi:hypothetical protein
VSLRLRRQQFDMDGVYLTPVFQKKWYPSAISPWNPAFPGMKISEREMTLPGTPHQRDFRFSRCPIVPFSHFEMLEANMVREKTRHGMASIMLGLCKSDVMPSHRI